MHTGRGNSIAGVVVVAHGGQAVSTERVTPVQPAVLRMIPLARAMRRALGGGIAVCRPLFHVRGWNGALASPVPDLIQVLDDISHDLKDVPVVLAGHSMGARAALRAAGHPAVLGVAALAPWLPGGEPTGQLAGRRILLAHGNSDTVTSLADTRSYALRARAVAHVAMVEVEGSGHAMLRRARLWHAMAAEFALASFGLPAASTELAAALRTATEHGTVL